MPDPIHEGGRVVRRLLIVGLLIAGALAGAAAWWLNQPLALNADRVDLSIEPGTSPRGVAQAVLEAGVDVHPAPLFWWFRFPGRPGRSGPAAMSWSAGSRREACCACWCAAKRPCAASRWWKAGTGARCARPWPGPNSSNPTARTFPTTMIMSRLGRAGIPAEGRFFPDTYTYAKGSSDLAVLRAPCMPWTGSWTPPGRSAHRYAAEDPEPRH
jgi:UPF0755 protein